MNKDVYILIDFQFFTMLKSGENLQ